MSKPGDSFSRASPRTWIILGASAATARAFARSAAGQGAALVLGGRDTEDLDLTAADLRARGAAAATTIRFDALDGATDAAVVDVVERTPGPVGLFVAFGVMPPQAELEAEPDRAAAVFATNLGGTARILLRLAPMLEARPDSRVVVVGSVAGDRGRRSNYVYGASKAGLHAFLQGYRARMHAFDVTVLTVKPGFLDTAMTWGLGPLPMALSPDAFATAVMRAAERRRDIAYVPRFWALVMTMIRLMPERLFKRLSI